MKYNTTAYFFILTLVFWGTSLISPVFSQTSNNVVPDQLDDTEYKLFIHQTDLPIQLDGVLDEPAWQKGKASGKWWQNFPNDSLHATGQTEMYMTYDDENLYVAVICYSAGNDFVTPTLRRDFSFMGNDNLSIHFDTYSDQTNSLFFGMNPQGCRREALISGGGRQRNTFNSSWDNKWDGDSKIYEDHWIGEFAIPFKTLRYKEGATTWRFSAYRNDTQTGERTTWLRIPQNRIIMDMTYMGTLVWDKPLKKAGKNISVIPYMASSITRDFEDVDQTKPESNFNFGGDAKIAITSGLNLDLTVNPDFSQVEVDRQVTNLDRFEIFFPERRQFFLENSDLFAGFGIGRVNPFFSRRIGIAQDTASGNNIQNTILYGARLSGKLNDRTRVGLLNMQTAKQVENDLPSFNYTVATVEQNVFARSSIAAIIVNKQAINSEDFTGSVDKYNRVVGAEYRLASEDNVWNGKASYFQAITTDDVIKDKWSHFFQLEYIKRKYRLEFAHLFVGAGFDAQLGFVPRKDILLVSPEFGLNFFPKKSSKISQHSINVDTRWLYKTGNDGNAVLTEFGFAENEISADWNFRFKNTTNFNISASYNNILLTDDFDPTRIQDDDVFLPAGEAYRFANFGLAYRSDARKTFSYSLRTNFGQFYSGIRAGFNGSLTYRYQPYGFISLDFNYNRINLDGDFKTANLWLVGPRIDLTFTKKLFLTTFIQYNNQQDNLNINTRFQWRFAPVSDFFLVYTDNYNTEEFGQFSSLNNAVRNRALVAKITYWLNL